MEQECELKLPLDSGMRLWLEDLSASVAAAVSRAQSEAFEDADLASSVLELSAIGSRVQLLLAQDGASHELGMDGRETDDGRIRRSRPKQNPVHHVSSAEKNQGCNPEYLANAKAKKTAALAFRRGRKKRRTKRRR